MRFFADWQDFTHYAWFYHIPCYAKITDDDFVLAGRNLFYDVLLFVATWTHNAIIERGAQLMAAIASQPYEPGFPIYVEEFDTTEGL